MIEVEEVMEHYEKVVTINDPVEFVREFNKYLANDYPFSGLHLGELRTP